MPRSTSTPTSEGPGRLNGGAATFAAAAYKAEGVRPPRRAASCPTTSRPSSSSCTTSAAERKRRGRRTTTTRRRAFVARWTRFLRGHAGLWLPRFAASVRALAEQEVYVAMAELLTAHLAVELGAHAHRTAPTGPGK